MLADAKGRPLRLALTAGHVHDLKAARALTVALPQADALLADRAYDCNWLRDRLAEARIAACIPPKKSRRAPARYDKTLYRQRHRIENTFARLKDWRRIATRYDRAAHTYRSAVLIAATVIFWLPK